MGEKLHSYFAEVDRGYRDDVRIANAWTTELNISDWYRWVRIG